ncbi:MAG: DUF2231 domain-containing protein [Flavitalea sp.]
MLSSTHVHAMVVHFPIALLFVGFTFEILSFFYKTDFYRKSAFYLLVLGTIGTIVSYFAGNAAGAGMEEGTLNKAMEMHEHAATFAFWLTIITSLVYVMTNYLKYKKGWLRIIGVLLFAGVMISITRTGYLGGQLVYKHGAGVELALPDFSSPE